MTCREANVDKPPGVLVDQFGRHHVDLRVSVTDRCNLRCTYCMPLDATFMRQEKLLTFDEVTRCVSVAAEMGVRTIRLTGGEPLMLSLIHI